MKQTLCFWKTLGHKLGKVQSWEENDIPQTHIISHESLILFTIIFSPVLQYNDSPDFGVQNSGRFWGHWGCLPRLIKCPLGSMIEWSLPEDPLGGVTGF